MNSYRPRGEQIFPLSALQIGILQKWHFTISEKVAIIKKLFGPQLSWESKLSAEQAHRFWYLA